MLKKTQIIAILLIAALPSSAPADLNEDLAKLRAAFDAKIAETEEPHIRYYLTQLKIIENALVEEGNYAGAIQTKNEIEALELQLAQLEADTLTGTKAISRAGTPEQIIFLPNSATTIGIIWDQESNSLRGWRTPDEAARWQLPNLPPGGYEVILEYEAGQSEGGDFVIAEDFFQLTGKIEPTGGETVKINFGTLKIRSGKNSLSLYATRTELGGLMRLKSIELVPAWR